MLVAKIQTRGRVMKSKKLSFWNAISIVALTLLTALFYVYSAILLGLWLLKRKIRMGLTTTRRRRRGSFLILSTIVDDQLVDWGSLLLFSSLI
jgi:hypothetical protein